MAQVVEPRVRIYSATSGTSDFVETQRAQGSLGIAELMAAGIIVAGATCDYVASYGDSFEAGINATIDASGHVVRPAVTIRSRHANGTINTSRVSFTTDLKTVILDFSSSRVANLIPLAAGAVRFDISQSLSAPMAAQARANAPPFASTTGAPFYQSTSPVGWTKQTTHSDKALRVTSGTISSGGSVDFSTCFARTATDSFTLTSTHVPPHNHVGITGIDSVDHNHTYLTAPSTTGQFVGPISANNGWGGTPTAALTSGIGVQAHTHDYNTSTFGSGGSHQLGMDMRVKFIDLIIATKD